MRILFISTIILVLTGCSQLPPITSIPRPISAEALQSAAKKPLKLPARNLIFNLNPYFTGGQTSIISLQKTGRAVLTQLRFEPAKACEGALSFSIGYSGKQSREVLFYYWPQGTVETDTKLQLIIEDAQFTISFQGQTKSFPLKSVPAYLSVYQSGN